MLPSLAARLLTADGAIAQRVAGLWLAGAGAHVSQEVRSRLVRAAAREAADAEILRQETATVLDALAAARIDVVLLKGRTLQPRWPAPRVGSDVDLLVAATDLDRAVATLAGYQAAPREGRRWLRPRQIGYELNPPPGRHAVVDLHAELFRVVGARLSGAAVRARAQWADIDGRRTRVLAPRDEALYLYVHAAKHAVRETKMLLDVCALPTAAVAEAAELARGLGLSRAFWATATLVAEVLPERRAPDAPWIAPLLRRTLRLDKTLAGTPLTRTDGYLLAALLEESLRVRTRYALGIAERLLRD